MLTSCVGYSLRAWANRQLDASTLVLYNAVQPPLTALLALVVQPGFTYGWSDALGSTMVMLPLTLTLTLTSSPYAHPHLTPSLTHTPTLTAHPDSHPHPHTLTPHPHPLILQVTSAVFICVRGEATIRSLVARLSLWQLAQAARARQRVATPLWKVNWPGSGAALKSAL